MSQKHHLNNGPLSVQPALTEDTHHASQSKHLPGWFVNIKTAELTAGFDRTSLTRMTRVVKGMARKNSMRYGVPETGYSVNLERWRTRRLDHETGLTRRNFLFLTGAAAVSIPKTSAKDYHQAVDMFWQDGPHGPGKDLLAHLYYPPILEQRLKRAGGDTDKMWDVIDRIRTQHISAILTMRGRYTIS